MRLTNDQKSLLRLVSRGEGENTKQLRDRFNREVGRIALVQAYESYLRNRLLRLTARGLLRQEIHAAGDHVCARCWFLTRAARAALAGGAK